MHVQIQPSEPYQEDSHTVTWNDEQIKVANLAEISKAYDEQYEVYKQVRAVVTQLKYPGREELLLKIIEQLDTRYLKLRYDYSSVKNSIEQFKFTLQNSQKHG